MYVAGVDGNLTAFNADTDDNETSRLQDENQVTRVVSNSNHILKSAVNSRDAKTAISISTINAKIIKEIDDAEITDNVSRF